MPAPAATGPTQIQLQQQQLQQHPVAGAESSADPWVDARRRSNALASVSDRSSEGAPAWQAAQAVPAKLTLRDGSGSVPLEVTSPLKQPLRAAADAGDVQRAVAASEEQQLEAEDVRPDPVAAAAAAAADAAAAAADAHHAAGYALRKAGMYEGAVREYSLALAADPAHFRALFNRAFSLDKVFGVLR